jgi:hypothetical protein
MHGVAAGAVGDAAGMESEGRTAKADRTYY